MDFVIILVKSVIIGGLLGFAASVGAARMFHAPNTQGLGAFRTLGEMNACMGDPASHFSFGLGFFFNAWASSVGAGAFTQDVTHRIIPNWAAAALLAKNKDVTQTMHDPKKMGIIGAVIGAVVVAFLNTTAAAIPEALQVTDGFRFGTSSDDSDQYSNASYFLVGSFRRRETNWFLGHSFWWYRAIDYGKCGTWCCSRNLDW